jgi:hypothetical protein
LVKGRLDFVAVRKGFLTAREGPVPADVDIGRAQNGIWHKKAARRVTTGRQAFQ